MAEDSETNNTIRLIRLVKEYPVLWDDTKPRQRRNESWNAVLTSFVPDFEKLDQKKIRDDVKKEWTRIREQFNKCRKEGKTFKYKGCEIHNELDFLLPVFEEKEKRQPSIIKSLLQEKAGPSNVPLGALNHLIDPDAETVVNYNLKSDDLETNNSVEIELSSDSSNYQAGETEQKLLSRTNPTKSLFGSINIDQNYVLRDSDNLNVANGRGKTLYGHFPNVEEGYNELRPPHTLSPLSPQLDIKQSLSPPSFQSIRSLENKTSSQSNFKGVKRPCFDENEKGDQEHYLLNLVESFTEHFDCSQNTNFSLEILPLLQSHLSKGSNLSNAEMKDFNSRALRVLLSTIKNLDSKERLKIMATIFNCVLKANNRDNCIDDQ